MFEAPFLLRVRFRGVGRRLERLEVEGGVCPILLDYWEMRAATEVLQGGLNTRDEGEANSLIFGGKPKINHDLRCCRDRKTVAALSPLTSISEEGGSSHL
ncbi:hypothetical protein Droror1_Dr00014358 [Drosera rotundifolia]